LVESVHNEQDADKCRGGTEEGVKLIQGTAGKEGVLVAPTPASVSHHEAAAAARTNLAEGFVGKFATCKSLIIILLFSLLVRLGWSTASCCGHPTEVS